MASASFVQNLIDYYVNCLIIQYHDQPTARAEIALYAKVLLADGVFFDVLTGYNVDSDLGPTAVGNQLDVIGKYVGVSRIYRDLSLVDYFSMPSYIDNPTSPPQYGFETYATFATDNDFNGTLAYDKIASVNNRLIDSIYLQILLLKIALNNMNYSNKAIDDLMFRFFALTVRPEDARNMHMVYFIAANPSPLVLAAIYNDLLPHPMAVGVVHVNDVQGLMFAMPSYGDNAINDTAYGYGFSTYADYDTLPQQQTLSYDQITVP